MLQYIVVGRNYGFNQRQRQYNRSGEIKEMRLMFEHFAKITFYLCSTQLFRLTGVLSFGDAFFNSVMVQGFNKNGVQEYNQ